MIKVILSLCDLTGNWPSFYRDGYRVICMDLKRGQDIRLTEKLTEPVHGILAVPDCTVFSSSGARWPRTDEDMRQGLALVDACLRAVIIYRPVWWCLENPIGKLVRYLGKPKMYFDPCDYGDPWTKKTALWGEFIEPVKNRVPANEFWGWRKLGGKSKRTKELRSATPLGFAKAFREVNP